MTPAMTADGDLPAPLTPAGLDLRGLTAFLLDTKRLLLSELWTRSTGDELKAALALWCHAWQQVPAASLPNDDGYLAKLAGVGRMKWRSLKAMALHGFQLCADGRLHHPVLAKDAIRAGRVVAAAQARRARAGQPQGVQAVQVQQQPELPIAASPPAFRKKHPPLSVDKSLETLKRRSTIDISIKQEAAAGDPEAAREPAAAASGGLDQEVESTLAEVEAKLATAWPETPRRRHQADPATVEGWLSEGIGREQVVRSIATIAARDAAAHRPPPSSLRYFGAMVRLPAGGRPRPAARPGGALAGHSAGGEPWSARLHTWQTAGIWREDWGPRPGADRCRVPPAFLAATAGPGAAAG